MGQATRRRNPAAASAHRRGSSGNVVMELELFQGAITPGGKSHNNLKSVRPSLNVEQEG